MCLSVNIRSIPITSVGPNRIGRMDTLAKLGKHSSVLSQSQSMMSFITISLVASFVLLRTC